MTGQLHFDVCHGVEKSTNDVQDMQSNLEEIQNSAGNSLEKIPSLKDIEVH